MRGMPTPPPVGYPDNEQSIFYMCKITIFINIYQLIARRASNTTHWWMWEVPTPVEIIGCKTDLPTAKSSRSAHKSKHKEKTVIFPLFCNKSQTPSAFTCSRSFGCVIPTIPKICDWEVLLNYSWCSASISGKYEKFAMNIATKNEHQIKNESLTVKTEYSPVRQ